MTTGPEHYRKAESLLALAEHDSTTLEGAMRRIAAAQTHATLALTAATALNDYEGGMPAADCLVWAHTVSVNGQDERTGPDCTCGGGPVHQLHCDAPGEDAEDGAQ
jgi:hypothetical protein